MAEKKENDINAKNGRIVISGNVNGSNIFQGDNNVVINRNINLTPLFESIYDFVEKHPKLQAGKKKDALEELKEIQSALEGSNPDENFITRRFRNLKRMAPDIVDVAIETLKNPISGIVELINKVAQKMKEDAK